MCIRDRLCEKGFREKYIGCGEYSDEELKKIHADMDYELGIIKTMGFIEYILLVWDYINWCRTHDCWVGPGPVSYTHLCRNHRPWQYVRCGGVLQDGKGK